MSSPLYVEVHKDQLSSELRAAACSEALSLWTEDRIDDLDIAGFHVIEHIPENPKHASFFGVGSYNPITEDYAADMITARLSWMHTEFPAIFKTLQLLCDLPTEIGLPTSTLPTSFTVNYYQPGQVTDKHQDTGTPEFDRIARVANILGEGATWFSQKNDGKYVPCATNEGDILSFPNHRNARPWHFGEGNDSEMRISIGLQLRGDLKV